MTLIDPLILLNYAWIPSDFRQTYEGDIKTIFDKYELNEKAKAIMNAIQIKMKQKKLTDEGKQRKGRIVTKLFYEKSTLWLNSNLFMLVLPLFNFFMARGRYHIETSPLICFANQWAGFCLITASVMKELRHLF